ncbi:MAG TPA: cell division protein FtsQ/DivIB [Thiobacillus sp.]|nr:MAG: cell division protein FtsQ [Hydrogenophilales bacterium 16-64-40]OZA34071.1 MAG: cell division protein FtsQ [Hydrogenophilales bacterium 17-64-65]HQS83056.1 cell division protein FtsQ/DivIB [Thiobacillus sp.]HQT33669.1 cell division protein FtsQ/DivIB [Thiobacillus sp.]
MTSPELAAHPLTQVARVLTWGALGLLAYGGASWVMAQPWFALRNIEVKTPVAHVTEAQIRLVAERQVRGTFFTVDLENVRNSMEKLPWVREARVERRWPDTLVVSLTEHVPLARWNDNALVNEAGEVFVAAADTRLPRLSGPEDSSDEVVAAYRRHHAALAPLGMAIDELRLSPRRAWRLKLDNGMTLALGREQTDARLTRFVALYPRLFGAQAAVSADAPAAAPMTPVTVDLRYPDGFAVRMPDGVSPFKSSET